MVRWRVACGAVVPCSYNRVTAERTLVEALLEHGLQHPGPDPDIVQEWKHSRVTYLGG